MELKDICITGLANSVFPQIILDGIESKTLDDL